MSWARLFFATYISNGHGLTVPVYLLFFILPVGGQRWKAQVQPPLHHVHSFCAMRRVAVNFWRRHLVGEAKTGFHLQRCEPEN
jgi:hypothetical protein